MKYFVKRLTGCFHLLLLYVFELYITCMGAFVDAVKYRLLLHLEVRSKVFHFPSVDMLYDILESMYRDMQCIYLHEVLSVFQALVNLADL